MNNLPKVKAEGPGVELHGDVRSRKSSALATTPPDHPLRPPTQTTHSPRLADYQQTCGRPHNRKYVTSTPRSAARTRPSHSHTGRPDIRRNAGPVVSEIRGRRDGQIDRHAYRNSQSPLRGRQTRSESDCCEEAGRPETR